LKVSRAYFGWLKYESVMFKAGNAVINLDIVVDNQALAGLNQTSEAWRARRPYAEISYRFSP